MNVARAFRGVAVARRDLPGLFRDIAYEGTSVHAARRGAARRLSLLVAACTRLRRGDECLYRQQPDVRRARDLLHGHADAMRAFAADNLARKIPFR